MGSCILCLELNENFVGGIKVNSVEWQELDVKNLIEKHFWPLDVMQTSSWLCTTCWQELYDFHKFYIRIEEAHVELRYVKNIDTNYLRNVIRNEDFKPPIEKVTFDEAHFEPEISIKLSHFTKALIEEEKVVIKEEEHEELLSDEISILKKNKVRLKKNSTPNITTVSEDPLNKNEQLNSSTSKKPRTSKLKVLNGKLIKSTNLHVTQIIDPSQIIKYAEFSKAAGDSANSNESDTDYNCEPYKETSITAANKSVDKPKSTNHKNDIFLAENFKITCSICEMQTKTFHELCKHFKIEHKKIGFVICCKKKFYRRSLLVDHVHQHVDPNYFKCTFCNKVMADRKCLNMHNKTHYDKREKAHHCDICNKNFSVHLSLKIHQMSHIPEEEKRVPCVQCGKRYASKWLLSNHVRAVHLKKNVKICDICGKSVSCKEVFERHMLQHEGKPLPSISCDVCGLQLASKHGLKRHKLMVHPEGGKQEFTCPVCSKISPNLKAHKKHIQYNHKWGYDHKCTICDKAFKTAHSLTEHMASHTGTVLYTCPWCPKTFNSNANFYSHRKKGHPKEWEEATRKKYSGNLPPNYKPPTTNNLNDYGLPLHMQ